MAVDRVHLEVHRDALLLRERVGVDLGAGQVRRTKSGHIICIVYVVPTYLHIHLSTYLPIYISLGSASSTCVSPFALSYT